MTTVQTRDGVIRGEDLGGVLRFRGIPFAAPPVGERRWQPPARPEPWDGELDATEFGPMAPQPPGGGGQFLAPDTPEDEDCLTLNVWTPATDGSRPVMVWFHGGGYRQGSSRSPFYDGEPLARRGDVVVVTVNYRLGALGFAAHPDLRSDDSGPAGNWGLLDQVEALRWVKDNAATFGGDAGNVTIFGESAGAGCVAALLAAPPAAGLFHRGVVQSGAGVALSLEQAAKATEELSVAAGVADVAGLRDLPVDQLIAAQSRVDTGTGAMTFLPCVDGHLLTERPLAAIAAGASSGVPVIVGTNRDEWKLWAPADRKSRTLDDDALLRRVERRTRDGAQEVIDGLRRLRSARGEECEPKDLWFAFESERFFRVPALQLADALVGRGPTFVYLFSWPSPAMGGWLGACHGLEIAFVFGTHGRGELARFTGSGADADRLAETMMDCWIAFARTGDPSTDAVAWPPYGPDRPTVLFDAKTEVANAPFDDDRVLVEAHGRGLAT
jgi:para-nitrobenzyl esterase